MTYEALAEKAKGLPEEQLLEIEHYIDFLKFKLRHQSDTAQKANRKLGWFKNDLKYIADDFDVTPEDFKEYI